MTEEATKEYQRKYRLKNKEYFRLYFRTYIRKDKDYYKKWYQKNKDKMNEYFREYYRELDNKKLRDCRNTINNLINQKKVKIKIKECSLCNSTDNLEKHHPNYDEPLKVEILCKKCHKKLHRVHSKETK